MVIDLRQAQEVVKQYFKQKIDSGKTTADGWDIVDMCAEINKQLEECADVSGGIKCET